jgi:hypothetical protein
VEVRVGWMVVANRAAAVRAVALMVVDVVAGV